MQAKREAREVMWGARVFATVLVVLIAFTVTRPAFARQEPNKPTAAQDQYVPVERPMTPGDNLPAPKMLAAAYAFVWVVLLVYLWSIRRRLATVESEMANVSRRITQGNPRA